MPCIGVGVDILHVEKFSRIVEKRGSRFLDRVFTHGERNDCEGDEFPLEAYSACFSAKEAFVKALGIGLRRGIRWKDIEVDRCRSAGPGLIVTGRAREIAEGSGARKYHLSMSQTAGCVMALVLLED